MNRDSSTEYRRIFYRQFGNRNTGDDYHGRCFADLWQLDFDNFDIIARRYRSTIDVHRFPSCVRTRLSNDSFDFVVWTVWASSKDSPMSNKAVAFVLVSPLEPVAFSSTNNNTQLNPTFAYAANVLSVFEKNSSRIVSNLSKTSFDLHLTIFDRYSSVSDI